MNENRLKKISEENIDLMIRKNQAYSGQSGDNITNTGLNGIAVRLMDKVTRLHNLTSNPKNLDFESISDTMNDISNYALIGRLVEEGEWQELPRYVYLAGPINGITVTEGKTWRDTVAWTLGEFGIGSFSPIGANNIGDLKRTSKIIVNIDKFAISQCDLVLVNLSGPGRAFGTIREIEYARTLNKRVIVIGSGLTSAFAYDVEVVETFDDALHLILGKALTDDHQD